MCTALWPVEALHRGVTAPVMGGECATRGTWGGASPPAKFFSSMRILSVRGQLSRETSAPESSDWRKHLSVEMPRRRRSARHTVFSRSRLGRTKQHPTTGKRRSSACLNAAHVALGKHHVQNARLLECSCTVRLSPKPVSFSLPSMSKFGNAARIGLFSTPILADAAIGRKYGSHNGLGWSRALLCAKTACDGTVFALS